MRKGLLLLGAAAVMSAPAVFGQTVKKVVCEEKTGTWCGYCPYGIVSMWNLDESEDNFIGVAIHNSDPMANSAYDDASDALPDFSGYPYAAADRKTGAHAASVSTSFNAHKNDTPAGAVSVGANYDSGDNKIYITVGVTMDSDESGDWRLAAVITENNVTGTSGTYGHANYFSDADYPTGPDGLVGGPDGLDWDAQPGTVPASMMTYMHVARKMANDEYTGDAGSLPSTLTTGETYYYTYEVTKQSIWDENELHVVGMLIEPDGEINNAADVTVTAATSSIDEEEASFGLSVFPNPTADFTTVRVETEEASDVTVQVFNLMGAVVYTESAQNVAPGAYNYNVDVTDFASGIYTVRTTVNDIVKTAKLSVK